jgi:hypothetical protein
MTKTLLAAALSIALAPAAWAQDAAPTSSTPSATTLDAVSVIGSGEARQVQRITRENLDILPPGTSLQKTLEPAAGRQRAVGRCAGHQRAVDDPQPARLQLHPPRLHARRRRWAMARTTTTTA